MRIFNRIVLILLLAAIIAAGIFAVLYGFSLGGFNLDSIKINGVTSALPGFEQGVQNADPLILAALVAVAVVGLILLIAELKPPAPRRVKLGNGCFVSRGAVEQAAEGMALEEEGVLDARARAKPRRVRRAKLSLQVKARYGEDTRKLEESLRRRLQSGLGEEAGLPVGKPRLSVEAVEPWKAKRRVR